MMLGVYCAMPRVCPKCHDTIYTRREWCVPASWYEAHGHSLANTIHPERIPEAKQIWVCTSCDFGWTNPFNAEYLYEQGDLPAQPLTSTTARTRPPHQTN
ncbi:hypothetical protein BH10CYA1_BH10CYA1_40270 [soil metagenome]